MQEYKIKIPNAEISKQVQDKAIQLGYAKNEYIYNNDNDETIESIYLHYNDTLIRTGWGGLNDDAYFRRQQFEEISYQDFLRIGEIDVNNCKIRLTRQNLVALNTKLIDLGIKGYANRNEYVQINNPVRDLWGPTLSIPNHYNAYNPDFMFIRDGRTVMVGAERYFNQLPEQEVTVTQIMQLQPVLTTLNTNTEIMSELTLKCSKQPKNAKNLTLDQDYVGILIDDEGSQVDTIKEAKYFMCTNNSGNEARYSISLFKELANAAPVPQRRPVAPPPPPQPVAMPFDDWLESDDLLEIYSEEEDDKYNISVSILSPMAGENRIDDLNILGYSYSDVSCGVGQVFSINDFYSTLKTELDQINQRFYQNTLTDDEVTNAIKVIFEKVLQWIAVNRSKLFLFLSTNESYPALIPIIDQIAEANGNVSGVNRNSNNTIHLWIYRQK